MKNCRVRSVLFQIVYPSKWHEIVTQSILPHICLNFLPVKVTGRLFFYPSDLKSTRDLSGRRVLIYTLMIECGQGTGPVFEEVMDA